MFDLLPVIHSEGLLLFSQRL